MEWDMEENFSMEWNMEENFSMEWNMEWKIFGMEWKKIASMEYGKIVFHSIPYHALIVPAVFSYFFKDLNVLPTVLFTIAYRLPISSYFKFVLGLFQIYFEKLSTRTAV